MHPIKFQIISQKLTDSDKSGLAGALFLVQWEVFVCFKLNWGSIIYFRDIFEQQKTKIFILTIASEIVMCEPVFLLTN